MAYGSIKMQNQGKENALPHQLSYPISSKGWGESTVTLKHRPTSPSPLQLEPSRGGQGWPSSLMSANWEY